jgi:DNA-directed RNA polymerase subunit RPC12/RpoP
MSDSTRDLLVRGIAAAKAGDRDEARFFLEWALRREPPLPDRLDAWLWLSEISEDAGEKRRCLEEVLARDPANPRGRRLLAVLDGKLAPDEIVDADRLAVLQPNGAQRATAARFACAACGGKMVFSPDGQALVCQYCGRRRQSPQAVAVEQDFIVAMATGRGHRVPVATRTFACQGCGTPFLLGPERVSITCPYCASPHVVEDSNTRELIPPDAVIPFGLTAAQAAEACRTWLQRQKIRAGAQACQGIYLPAWVYDISGQVPWSGLRYDAVRKDWIPIAGTELAEATDLPVPAGHLEDRPIAEALSSFDYRLLRPYDPSYLSDWPAETYQRSMADSALVARQAVFTGIRDRLKETLGGEIRDLRMTSTGIAIDSFQLILAPVWLSVYVVDGRRLHLVVNGVTGEVHGERPPGALRAWLERVLGDGGSSTS